MRHNAIVISGLPGSGKNKLSKKLSEKHRWKVFSVGDLWREKWAKTHPSREISFENYWKNLTLKEQIEMNQKARETVVQGNVIGEFRYAIICKNLSALFLFLTSDIEIRAKRALEVGKYKGKSQEEVKQILTQREIDEVNLGKQFFGEDYDYRDHSQYDLVLETDKLTIEEELEKINKKLNQ